MPEWKAERIMTAVGHAWEITCGNRAIATTPDDEHDPEADARAEADARLIVRAVNEYLARAELI